MALSRGSKGFLIVVIVVGVVLGGGLTLLSRGGVAASTQPVSVEIPEGVGAAEVANLLEERGVIGSAFPFKLRARFDGRADQIRPGTYSLTPGMNAGDILAVLSAAPPAAPSFRVTIPEGLTVAQTLQRIADAPDSPFTVEALQVALPGVALPEWVPLQSIPAEQPYPGLTPYEGLLFPDTYDFRQDLPAQDVLARLILRTEEILNAVPPSAGGLDRYQVLVIGSLIEREARLREEQPVISSVIHNRITDGTALNIDATVLYANASTANQVLNSDLERESPWNTYVVPGLPPTPISGAGASALAAAAAPQATEFRYYVVSDPNTGSHAFAETFEEHQNNVARYRELVGG